MRLIPTYRKFKRRILARHIGLVRVGLFVGIVLFIFGLSNLITSSVSGTSIGMLSSSFYNFAFTPDKTVRSFNDRTNILLLGKAGSDINSAPELTDTIMLASVKNSSPQEVDLISIPRDIWIPEIDDKINAGYMIGNEKMDNGGVKLSKSIVEDILGIPVHYAMVVDFSAITEAVDIIGGINVDVERSFVDEKYPIPGLENAECSGDPDFKCRYETVQFLAGEQKMDGETALKFSRSRQSTDPKEGNDLARAARQQKVVAALQSEILSRKVITSPGKLKRLYDLFGDKVETDLTLNQLALIARRFLQSDSDLDSNVLPEELLYNPPIDEEYNYLYVFVPANEDGQWTDVQSWVKSVLD